MKTMLEMATLRINALAKANTLKLLTKASCGCLLASMFAQHAFADQNASYKSAQTKQQKPAFQKISKEHFRSTWKPPKQKSNQPRQSIIIVYNNQRPAVVGVGSAHQAKPLPPGWYKKYRRGDILDHDIFSHGRVINRTPSGIIRIEIDGTVVRLIEDTREILSIFSR